MNILQKNLTAKRKKFRRVESASDKMRRYISFERLATHKAPGEDKRHPYIKRQGRDCSTSQFAPVRNHLDLVVSGSGVENQLGGLL